LTVITFLTDFGLEDDFVGTCHGVMAGIAPDSRVIDVTHGIGPQAVLTGALVLKNTTQFMPVGVHLAVVDPDVGGHRRAVAIRTTDGRTFVGPDNGLLTLAADEIGIEAVHELSDPRFQMHEVSRTFHARDIFAPAAAHIAAGVDVSELGPALDPASLVRVDVPEPEVGRTQISAKALVVDRFGNIATNARREHLERLDLDDGDRVEIRLTLDRYYAFVAQTFSDTEPGELIVYEDSYGLLSLAISQGNAARLTGVSAGDEGRDLALVHPAGRGETVDVRAPRGTHPREAVGGRACLQRGRLEGRLPLDQARGCGCECLAGMLELREHLPALCAHPAQALEAGDHLVQVA
jgi:hypothetical protein